MPHYRLVRPGSQAESLTLRGHVCPRFLRNRPTRVTSYSEKRKIFRMADPTISKKYFLYVGIVLLVLIFFSYANTLNSPFNFDDYVIFQVVNWSPTKSCGFSPIEYRHLFFQSFCITQSQKGLDPFWYHLVNISLHFLTSLTLFFPREHPSLPF